MILKFLILLLVCCGSANSCVLHGTDNSTATTVTTTNKPTTTLPPVIQAKIWETCCINSTSGARYGCMADQKNDALSCMSGDKQFVEMVCLKDTSDPCSLYFEQSILYGEYKSKIYSLNMDSPSSYLMIQRNIVAKNQDFFNKNINAMKKPLFTPVNIEPVGNFWIGLDLITYLTNINGYIANLEIKVNHTVNNDMFTVHYNKINIETGSFQIQLEGFSYSDADNGVQILDAMTESPSSINGNTLANSMNFATDTTCTYEQKGAWWMNEGCSKSNLNSDNGLNGWQYSTANSATAITGSLMGIRYSQEVIS